MNESEEQNDKLLFLRKETESDQDNNCSVPQSQKSMTQAQQQKSGGGNFSFFDKMAELESEKFSRDKVESTQ